MARGDRQQQERERTAEERARDRQERARRRAAREGRSLPESVEIPPVEVPPGDVRLPAAEEVAVDSGPSSDPPLDPALDPAFAAAIQEPDYDPYTDPGPVPDDIPLAEEETSAELFAKEAEAGDGSPAQAAGEALEAGVAPVAETPAEPMRDGEPAGPDAAYPAADTELVPHMEELVEPQLVPEPEEALNEGAGEVPFPDATEAALDEGAGEVRFPIAPVEPVPELPTEAAFPSAPVEPAPELPAEAPSFDQPPEPAPAVDAAVPMVAAFDALPETVSEPLAGAAPRPADAPRADADPAARWEPVGIRVGDLAGSPDATGTAVRQATREGGPAPARGSGGRVPPPPGVPGRPGAGGHRRHGPRSGSARLLAVVGLVIAAAIVFVLVRSLRGSSAPKPPPPPAVVHLLIPEGLTRLQVADLAAKRGLRGDYRVASRTSNLLSPQEYGAPARTHDLEGFLFPATYDEYPGASVERLVSDQLIAFKENLPTDIVARARALHLSVYDVLIVASMVEREARLPADRAKVAAVIYNRLRREIPLAVDATLYYAIEVKENVPTYTAELTEAQLHMSSAYNTRIHAGLPPTPISNPGVAAVAAAANPANVPYLYYVNGADGCGELAFSSTIAEFEHNAAAYREAVAANHGKPPTCKHK